MPHQAFLYESFANLPQGRFDAIAVEMCVYQGNKPLYIFGLLPFMYAGDEVKFVNGNIAINSDSLNNPKLAHSIIQLLYQGMDDFFTPQKIHHVCGGAKVGAMCCDVFRQPEK